MAKAITSYDVILSVNTSQKNGYEASVNHNIEKLSITPATSDFQNLFIHKLSS